MAAAARLPFVLLLLALLALFALSSNKVSAADPDMHQDLCVADLNSTIKVNGYTCKSTFTADDFTFAGMANPGNTNNSQGSAVTVADVQQIPGLHTLGVSMARIDYAPGGLNPPHTHPRASEMLFVLEGSLEVGFITTSNVRVSKTIPKGSACVFPRGLVHFQKNNDKVPASVISAFNSELPGTQSIAFTLFAASPSVPDYVLTKAFQISTKEVEIIKSKLAPKK